MLLDGPINVSCSTREYVVIANRILHAVLGVLALVIVPIQIVTTLVLGLLVSVTFGLFLLPLSLIWMLFLAPLLLLSWACDKVPIMRVAVGVCFCPWAVVSDAYVCMIPSMGEMESRAQKMLLCQTWPYSWQFWQFSRHELDWESSLAIDLREVVNRASIGNPLFQRTVQRIRDGEELDAHV